MTPTECVTLLAYLAARCPAMRVEDATPDAWYDDLRDIRFDDARECARRLTAVKPFVSLSELLADVKRLRADRVERLAGTIPAPPAEISEDPRAQIRWHREQIRRLANGEPLLEDLVALTSHPVGALLAGAFQGTPPAVARCANCGRPAPADVVRFDCECGWTSTPPVVREAAG